MRLFSGQTLVAALLAITTAGDALAAHGVKHHHTHAKIHATSEEGKSTIQERQSPPESFSIELVNNLDSDSVRAYIVTNSAGSDQALLITAEGTIYRPVSGEMGVATIIPESANCGIKLGALGTTTTIVMPVHMLQGRVYISDGELDIGVLPTDYGSFLQMPSFAANSDPNFNTSFGFVEANMPEACMWANPTYVDFTGLPLGLEMVFEDATMNVSGLPFDGISELCQGLKEEESKDNYPWSKLCINNEDGKPFRVLSPQHKADRFSDYYDEYIDRVWHELADTGIQFDLQDGSPLVSCTFAADEMICDRPSAPFPKPKTTDIWGCNSGPFAQTSDTCYNLIGARFCAAFHRATLLLPGGNLQPNQSFDTYYPDGGPSNKYSKRLHQVQTDHQGYAFPYDDVKPDPASKVSGLIAGDNPRILRIIVGGHEPAKSQDSEPYEGSSGSAKSSASAQSIPASRSHDNSHAESAPSSTESSTPISSPSPSSDQPTSSTPPAYLSTEQYLPNTSPESTTADPTASLLQTSVTLNREEVSMPSPSKNGGTPSVVEVLVIETTFMTQFVTKTECVSSLSTITWNS
ncbi:hypothetical protein WHR41_04899 [Cladosporium halotolerans]|uniref:GH64 domain-containing protein n=1 Tax=Cladosporium halotolerans TaxID=1052096 RepID=A0AB34KLR5_9PEZI